jgi:DNA replication protein DnaC
MKSGLAKFDLLILDELGYVPASKLGAELLFEVISSAYERQSLIVTANLFQPPRAALFDRRIYGAPDTRLADVPRCCSSSVNAY